MAFTKCKKGFCSTALLFLIMLTLSLCTNASPTSLEEIPLVPGSKLDLEEAAFWEENIGFGNSYLFVGGTQLPLLSEDHAFYSVNAPLEDVARYYLRELNAIEEYNSGYDLEILDYGESSPVYMEYSLYDWQFEDDYDYEGKLIRSGKMIRDTLTKNRKSWASGGWLARVYISWSYKDLDGNLVLFAVDCEDRSFGLDYTEFEGTRTLISMHQYTHMSAEDTWDMEDEAMDAEIAGLSLKMALSPPTAESIGIPIYPNAEFQPDISAGMSLSGSNMYIFLTTDTPGEVIRWYEQKTGKTAQSWEANSYFIAISGQAPFPEKGLTVQPNMLFGGAWQTVITLVTADGPSDDWDY